MNSELSPLRQDGFTERMARSWLSSLEDERASGLYDPERLAEIHASGYLAGCACSYDQAKLDSGEYLRDYDHFRLWPLNSWQRIWINDKLTLFYMLNGTSFGKYLPEYFFYSTSEGNLSAVPPQNPRESLSDVLRARGDVACKPCNGTGSEGFFRLSFRDGIYLINGGEVREEDIERFPSEHPNYVFTEFLLPESSMARIDPLIHTLRVLVVNHHGTDPVPVGTYLRFGMKEVAEKTGSANYTYLRTAEDRDFVCHVDMASGVYGSSKLVYATRIEDAPVHPDSNLEASGLISCWDEVVGLSQGIAEYMPLLSLLGFDVGITESGPKIMEINSHPGVHYVQLFDPLMANPRFRSFIEEHDASLRAMDEQARERHWRIVR